MTTIMPRTRRYSFPPSMKSTTRASEARIRSLFIRKSMYLGYFGQPPIDSGLRSLRWDYGRCKHERPILDASSRPRFRSSELKSANGQTWAWSGAVY